MFHFCKLPLRTTASEFHQDRVQAKYPGALKEGAGSVMDTRNINTYPELIILARRAFLYKCTIICRNIPMMGIFF